jgi:hypothetical protein
MSYDIVKSIKVRDGKVYLKSASNNVYPHTYDEWECSSLTKILNEEGEEGLDVAILGDYEKGNFQGSGTKYVRLLAILRHLPEYAAFDWRQNGPGYDKAQELRKSPAYNALLRKVLSMRMPKDKYIVKKDYYGDYQAKTVYLKSFGGRLARWTGDKAGAKVFRFIEDAEWIKKCFSNTDSWQVEKVA